MGICVREGLLERWCPWRTEVSGLPEAGVTAGCVRLLIQVLGLELRSSAQQYELLTAGLSLYPQLEKNIPLSRATLIDWSIMIIFGHLYFSIQ